MSSILTILLVVTTVVAATTSPRSQASKRASALENRIITPIIELNEELAAGVLVANLTELIRLRTNNLTMVESVRFDTTLPSAKQHQRSSGQFYLPDYFQIETKRVRSNQILENTTNSTNIVLRTSGKKLDREYLCRLSVLRGQCSCESDCIVWLDLIVDDSQPVRVPILVRDVNDNKPFFYTASLNIQLDLSSSTESSVRMPLKEAIDLDSMARHRVREYQIEEHRANEGDDDEEEESREGKVTVVFDEKADNKLNLVVEWNEENQAIR